MDRFVLIEHDGERYEIPTDGNQMRSETKALVKAVLPTDATILSVGGE